MPKTSETKTNTEIKHIISDLESEEKEEDEIKLIKKSSRI
jgi:hypothetical protein